MILSTASFHFSLSAHSFANFAFSHFLAFGYFECLSCLIFDLTALFIQFEPQSLHLDSEFNHYLLVG